MKLFKEIRQRVHTFKTVVHLNMRAHAQIGTFSNFYICIYNLKEPPSKQIQLSSLLQNTELGLRFNENTLSVEWLEHWWDYISKFTHLKHLKLDCKPGMLDSIVAMAKANKFKTTLWRITLTISTRDFHPGIIKNSLKRVPLIFKAIESLDILDIHLMGDVGHNFIVNKMCFNHGVTKFLNTEQVFIECIRDSDDDPYLMKLLQNYEKRATIAHEQRTGEEHQLRKDEEEKKNDETLMQIG